MKLPKRPMFGFALLAIGLLITGGVLYDIQSEQGDVRYAVRGTPSPFSSWRPRSYEILRVPDYLLGYLGLGVFTSTVGITILVSMRMDKRIVTFFGIVAIGLLIFQFLFVNRKDWNVYIDDLSVIDETGHIFTDPVSRETLNKAWGDVKLLHLETDEYISAPYSLALELRNDAPTGGESGGLIFFRNISRGWGTLNFTWYANVPDLKWHSFSWRKVESKIAVFFWLLEEDKEYRITVHAGLEYFYSASAQERITANLRTSFLDQSTGQQIPSDKVEPYDWRFDQWYKLTLILSENEGTASFYVDDDIVIQSLLLTEYLGNLREIRYYP
jgi:hypothetical protein